MKQPSVTSTAATATATSTSTSTGSRSRSSRVTAARPKQVVPPDNSNCQKVTRKTRPVASFGGPIPKERPLAERKRVVSAAKGTEQERRELKQRLERSESLVENLQSEVISLKTRLEKLQLRNDEIEAQNRRYEQDLSAADAKIESIQRERQAKFVAEEVRRSEHRNISKATADRLGNYGTEEKSSGNLITVVKLPDLSSQYLVPGAEELEREVPANAPLPPPLPMAFPVKNSPVCVTPPSPPPPPPPRCAPARTATMQKAPSLVQLYHSLTKSGRKNGPSTLVSCNGSGTNKVHNSIVGEIQNRSAHLLAIKADVESKGEFIKSLIEKVESVVFTDIEDVSVFIEYLDKELSTLADERAVLKHFSWPERKADAMREAAFEYRALKRVEIEVSLFEDDKSLTFEAALKKMANLLDKSERCVQRLTKLRDGTIISYGMCKIPTQWMLDSGIISQIKLATMKLAKICMKRVPMEVASIRHSEKEMIQEAMLLQCMCFAYRVHQFAGGLDVETMSAFEEFRQQIPSHGRESRELLPRIVVS